MRERLTYANVMVTVLAFVVLGGGAYAATHLGANTVGRRQLKRRSVTTAKLANGAVTRPKIAANSVTGQAVQDGSLSAADIDTSTLPKSFLSFSAVLGPNQSKTLSQGDFTFTETADGTGACTAIVLTVGPKSVRIPTSGSSVLNANANTTVGLTPSAGGQWTSAMATSDGSENLFVSLALTPVSGYCLTFGGVAPIG